MSIRALTPVLILVAAIVIALLAAVLKPAPEVAEPVLRPLLVDIVEVATQQMTISVKAQGSVAPQTQTQLVTEVEGRITEVSSVFVAGGFSRPAMCLCVSMTVIT